MSTAQDDSLTQFTRRRIKAGGDAIIDTLLPPQNLLGLEADPIAKRMWADVTFLDAPWCEACGFPFEYAVQGGSLCARCSVRRPDYDRARAPMAYDDGSRALILSFKHGGRSIRPAWSSAVIIKRRFWRALLPRFALLNLRRISFSVRAERTAKADLMPAPAWRMSGARFL